MISSLSADQNSGTGPFYFTPANIVRILGVEEMPRGTKTMNDDFEVGKEGIGRR